MNWTCFCPRELPEKTPVCGSCGMERPEAVTHSSLPYACDDCKEPTRLVQLTEALIRDGGDGRSRCAQCHVEYLKARAAADPISPAALRGLKLRLEEYYAKAGEKWTSKRL